MLGIGLGVGDIVVIKVREICVFVEFVFSEEIKIK